MNTVYDIIKKPRLTEKSNLLQETQNTVVFSVASTANKIQIKEAVEQLFKVKVAKVATTRVIGKKKRVGIRSVGKSKDWKKAYVTLAEGNINFLDEL
ncbi:MAG: 50S ribosomal protein L23 [Desulfobulbaceae bacterium]|nr:50S ribosomal protein L23 [Desulfobulbaceae bacterium]